MKTVLDVTICTHSRGGVGRWVAGLSRGLTAVNPDHSSVDVPETHPIHATPVREARVLPFPFWTRIPLLRRKLYGAGRLEATRAKRIRRFVGTPDVIHLSGVQPFGFGRKTVVTFFDDTAWTAPGSHTADTLFFSRRLESLIRQGASVVAISEWTANRAIDLFGLPPERVCSVGGAPDEMFSPGAPDPGLLCRLGLEPGRYLLHVGSFVPRKNIPFLAESFMRASVPGMKLVLAGLERWGDQQIPSSGSIVCRDDVSDADLLSLYRGARALLLPSSEEGLGLPVLEAFACRTPVVSSDGGALPETVGECGLVLPALDGDVWVRAIRDLASEATVASLRAMAETYCRITWEDVGRKTLEFYRRITETAESH
ncbi:MAG: glycosyltransferase family 1 protein [Candidatus Fermentibacteraceae bacterium]